MGEADAIDDGAGNVGRAKRVEAKYVTTLLLLVVINTSELYGAGIGLIHHLVSPT